MSIPKNIAYTPLELLTCIIRIAHVGALLIILLLSIFGGIMFILSGPGWISIACLFLAGMLLMIQIVSRARYLAAVRALRFINGTLEVRHQAGGSPLQRRPLFLRDFSFSPIHGVLSQKDSPVSKSN